jgi:hypothetical protein
MRRGIIVIFMFCFLKIGLYGQTTMNNHYSTSDSSQLVILLLNVYNIDTIRYRKNKKELFRQFIDRSLEALAFELQGDTEQKCKVTIAETITDCNCNNDSSILALTSIKGASYAIALTYFDIYFSQTRVEVEKSSNGSKSKEAYCDLTTDIRFSIYRKGLFSRAITIKESKKHSSRPVLSGLLSTGPKMGGY